MKINDIRTPALIIDKKTFEENKEKMKELLEETPIKLRPHYKSHKCSAIAHAQINDGAIGITCAKLDEAADLVDSGIEDVLIANQIVGKEKVSRLASLARCAKITVCVDNKENVTDIENAAMLMDAKIYCLIEYEIGMQRCGVSKKEDVLSLVKHINSCKHLVFEGIQAYAGHLSHLACEEERRAKTEENARRIRELISYLNENAITVNTVSGGSTGTSVFKKNDTLYTELQAGSYLFMDATYNKLDVPFKPSLFLLTTVVSVNEKLAVVDGGVKSCGVDQGMPVPVGFEVSKVVDSEEHLQLHNPTKKLSVGDKVLLIPAHCCSTVNLHDKLYLVEDGRVSDRLTVSARGCFH